MAGTTYFPRGGPATSLRLLLTSLTSGREGDRSLRLTHTRLRVSHRYTRPHALYDSLSALPPHVCEGDGHQAAHPRGTHLRRRLSVCPGRLRSPPPDRRTDRPSHDTPARVPHRPQHLQHGVTPGNMNACTRAVPLLSQGWAGGKPQLQRIACDRKARAPPLARQPLRANPSRASGGHDLLPQRGACHLTPPTPHQPDQRKGRRPLTQAYSHQTPCVPPVHQTPRVVR